MYIYIYSLHIITHVLCFTRHCLCIAFYCCVNMPGSGLDVESEYICLHSIFGMTSRAGRIHAHTLILTQIHRHTDRYTLSHSHILSHTNTRTHTHTHTYTHAHIIPVSPRT